MTKHRPFWTSVHRWIGLLTSVLILVFCFSGLILNHRSLFSSCSVPRSILPSEYHIKNYNNGVVKGTLPLGEGRILVFGNSGVWLADSLMADVADFNSGLPEGPDNRNIRNIVKTSTGEVWCAAQFGVYRLNDSKWVEVPLPDCDERIADIALKKDSTSVVALSRSAVYPLTDKGFVRIELPTPAGYTRKVSMFKTLWMLHSGELFGLPGKIVVDSLAVVLSFLCVTGILLFILPYSIRKSGATAKFRLVKSFKWNFRWHDKIGYATIILTIIVAFTGMCLRPPLMVPFVLAKISPIPGTALASDNVWQDKLRGIRWDAADSRWLISTSEGFISADESFKADVTLPEKNTPPVSPMGITVFEPYSADKWLIGSFSGMYIWDPAAGTVKDYFTDKDYTPARGMRPTSDYLITGYSKDIKGRPLVFDYSKGCSIDLPMPAEIADQPMSLWNFALELHVGRCYNPVLGPFSALFIFMSGLILIIVLVSGLILHQKYKRLFNNA